MEYLLKVSVVVTIFYTIYKLFLQRETFFESNRWFLLIGLISSLMIPFIVIPIYIEYTPIAFPNLAVTEQLSNETIEKPFNILDYLPIIYGLGVIFFSVRFFIQLTSLIKIISKSHRIKKDRFVYIVTQNNTSPFSFFKWIVYNPETFSQTELKHIIEHEKTHANQFHSIDIIITQLFCILLWFNPFIWFYNKDLKQNLEFIADKRTLNQYHCKKSYQYTLLKTSIPSHHMALSNQFYNSLIKKRIVMLQKSKTKKINQFKYALVIPLLALFLISCNSEITDNNPDSLTEKEQSSSIKITAVGNKFGDGKQPLIIVDGKEITNDELEKLSPESINSMNVLKDENATKKYGDKGKNGVVEITTKAKSETKFIEGKSMDDIKVTGYGQKKDSTKIIIRGTSTINSNPMLILDGKEISNDELEKLHPDTIKAFDVLKGENATKKYGDKGKNGVIEITTKK